MARQTRLQVVAVTNPPRTAASENDKTGTVR